MKIFCKTSGGAELQLGSPVAVKTKHLEAPQFFSTFTVRFYMTSSCCAGANQLQSQSFSWVLRSLDPKAPEPFRSFDLYCQRSNDSFYLFLSDFCSCYIRRKK
ncbi:hypothetical protein CHARACLAT_006263 [Characodon lateralis]|uniref:Uncharacterized protein n=1 Tax=Characodon lateralis TaxID=208331 RepID=A0ABU7ERL7_9TELE|nr:hypothetical protein [Characodon lateralis]